MGEKEETKNNVEKKPVDGVEMTAADGGEMKEKTPITVVLKLDLHCEGCAKKVRRSVTQLEGVEKVKGDFDGKKLTVTGNVDPVWLREKVELKTKKKVELISPQPKKDDGGPGGDKTADEKSEKKKADEVEKPKEAVVSTVVMKIRLHCDGCANKIKRVILKNFGGVDSVATNLQKNLVTVIGTMNVNELATYLKGKLQRSVEIVPSKKVDENRDENEKKGGGDEKEKEGSDNGGGEKNEKERGGGGGGGDVGEKKEKESGGGGGGGGGGGDVGEKKEKESGGGGGGGGGGGEKKESDNDKKESETKALSSNEGTKLELDKMEYHNTHNPETYYAMPIYNQINENQHYETPMYHHQQGYYDTGHVMQYTQGPSLPPPTYLHTNDHMFSDENPNVCYVM